MAETDGSIRPFWRSLAAWFSVWPVLRGFQPIAAKSRRTAAWAAPTSRLLGYGS